MAASSADAKKLTYVFDDREQRGLGDAVTNSGATVEWRRLHDAGDIIIYCGDVPLMAFERKAGSDLTGSIKGNSHIFHQRDTLLNFSRETGCRVVLLVEDPVQRSWFGKTDGLTNKFIESVVSSTTLLRGLSLARTRGPDDTVALVTYIGGKIQKELNDLKCEPADFWSARAEGTLAFKPVTAAKGGRKANFDGKNAALALLQQIPGLSLQRARCILDDFESVADIVRYYKKHPEAGRGDKKAHDRVADVMVNKRRIGEASSQKLRSILFGEYEAAAADESKPKKKKKVAEEIVLE